MFYLRYDEYGEGRNSASNSDQTGTLSRASYHSSDPDHYPDLLDIPARSGDRAVTYRIVTFIIFYSFMSANFTTFKEPQIAKVYFNLRTRGT